MSATITRPLTTHAYFDVMDVLSKFEVVPVAYAPIMQSMAWTIDNSVIYAARGVLFDLYAEAEIDAGTEDRFAHFCQEVGDVIASESWYTNESDNPVKALAYLLSLRTVWHDIAQTVYHRNDRDYNPKSLRELLESEKPRKTNVTTRSNLKLLAERQAKGDSKKAERNLDMLLAREQMQAEDRAKDNRKLFPTILEIIESASRHAEHEVRFDQLPRSTQRRLTTAAIGVVERTITDTVAKDRSITSLQYMHALDIYEDVVDELNSVLTTRLHERGDLEDNSIRAQVAIDHERNQKRVAIATE